MLFRALQLNYDYPRGLRIYAEIRKSMGIMAVPGATGISGQLNLSVHYALYAWIRTLTKKPSIKAFWMSWAVARFGLVPSITNA
jgi:hypothetical protein